MLLHVQRRLPGLNGGSAARPARVARCTGGDGGNGAGLAEGVRVKVVKAVTVFHAPKAPADGLQLQGMEGVIARDVTQYKGKTLSANLPYQVAFTLERDGKPAKLLCHLVGTPAMHAHSRCLRECAWGAHYTAIVADTRILWQVNRTQHVRPAWPCAARRMRLRLSRSEQQRARALMVQPAA